MPQSQKHPDRSNTSPLRAPLTENPAGHEVYPVSTTWKVAPGTVVRAARPQRDREPKARPFRSLARRDPRKPLMALVKWRGGTEAWCEIRARGTSVRVPGCTTVAELVLLLNSQGYR